MTMKKNLFLFIQIIIVTIACTPRKNLCQISGLYSSHVHDSEHDLQINEDSSFVFYLKEGLTQDSIKGNWLLKQRQLLLFEVNEDSYWSLETEDSCEKLVVRVYDVSSLKLLDFYYKIFEENNLIKEAISGDTLEMNFYEKADSIYIGSLGYKSLGISLGKGMQTCIAVYLAKEDDEILSYKWKVKKNTIECSCGLILKKQ